MTDTKKKTVRIAYEATIRDGGVPRKIILQVGPGDVIQMRLERHREWTTPLALKELYMLAATRTADLKRQWK